MSHCEQCPGWYTETEAERDRHGDVVPIPVQAACPGCGHEAEIADLTHRLSVAELALGFPVVAAHVQRHEELEQRNANQREQLELLERIQDEEIALQVKLAEEAKDREHDTLRAEREVLLNSLEAIARFAKWSAGVLTENEEAVQCYDDVSAGVELALSRHGHPRSDQYAVVWMAKMEADLVVARADLGRAVEALKNVGCRGAWMAYGCPSRADGRLCIVCAALSPHPTPTTPGPAGEEA